MPINWHNVLTDLLPAGVVAYVFIGLVFGVRWWFIWPIGLIGWLIGGWAAIAEHAFRCGYRTGSALVNQPKRKPIDLGDTHRESPLD